MEHDITYCDQHCELIDTVKENHSLTREIHSVMISGLDGKPGVIERLKNLERYKSGVSRWFLLVISTGVVGIVTMIVDVIRGILK